MEQMIIEKDIDIVIISEQYQPMAAGVWTEDSTKTAAIWKPQGSKAIIIRSGSIECSVFATTTEYTIISCYLTPSDDMDAFKRKLEAIEDLARDFDGPVIIAGDFNAKAVEWGMPTTDF